MGRLDQGFISPFEALQYYNLDWYNHFYEKFKNSKVFNTDKNVRIYPVPYEDLDESTGKTHEFISEEVETFYDFLLSLEGDKDVFLKSNFEPTISGMDADGFAEYEESDYTPNLDNLSVKVIADLFINYLNDYLK